METNDARVLNSVYRGAKTGESEIETLLPSVESARFRADLRMQQREYGSISSAAASQMYGMGLEPEQVGALKKAGMKIATGINAAMAGGVSNLAELMIKGSSTGITNMTKVLNNNSPIRPETSDIAQRLILTEQQNIERLKTYL